MAHVKYTIMFFCSLLSRPVLATCTFT